MNIILNLIQNDEDFVFEAAKNNKEIVSGEKKYNQFYK